MLSDLRVRPRGSTEFSRAVWIRLRHKEPRPSMDRMGPRRLSRSVVVPPWLETDRECGAGTADPSQRLAYRTFSPPASHVSRLRRECGQTARQQRLARRHGRRTLGGPAPRSTDLPFHVKPRAHVPRASLLQAAAIVALETRTAFRGPTQRQHPHRSSVQTRPIGGDKRNSPEVTLSPVVELEARHDHLPSSALP